LRALHKNTLKHDALSLEVSFVFSHSVPAHVTHVPAERRAPEILNENKTSKLQNKKQDKSRDA